MRALYSRVPLSWGAGSSEHLGLGLGEEGHLQSGQQWDLGPSCPLKQFSSAVLALHSQPHPPLQGQPSILFAQEAFLKSSLVWCLMAPLQASVCRKPQAPPAAASPLAALL